MKKWKVVDDIMQNLEKQLNDLEHEQYTIYKIVDGIYECLIIAYKEIPKDQPSAQGNPTIIRAGVEE